MLGVNSWWGLHGETFVWTVIAIIASVAVSWYFFNRQKRKKTLDWWGVTNSKLIDSKLIQSTDADISISIDGREVSDLSVLVIAFQNTGNETIKADDYDGRLELEFANAGLVKAGIVRQSRDTKPQLESVDMEALKVCINPGMLLPREWFEVQVLIEGKSDYPDIRVRFVDQTEKPKRLSMVEVEPQPFLKDLGESLAAVGVLSVAAVSVGEYVPIPYSFVAFAVLAYLGFRLIKDILAMIHDRITKG